MVNVRFYGSLKQFGTKFRLDCKTPAEVVQALTSQIPKLRQFIQQGLFTVRVGQEYLDNRYLEQGLNQHLKDNSTVHFTPVLKGSKKAGLSQMLTKMPSMSTGKDAERKQSTSFSNLSNMAAQGRPMPLAYGRIRVGSLIISQGVETMDIERQPPEEKKGKIVPRFRNRS